MERRTFAKQRLLRVLGQIGHFGTQPIAAVAVAAPWKRAAGAIRSGSSVGLRGYEGIGAVGLHKLPFSKVLIANRGEIAVRIARACKDEGLSTVGIFAKEDAGSLHLRQVDEAVEVFSQKAGPIAPYLDVAGIVDVAKRTGAGAVHPGYGFLSESSEFAAAVEAAGIRFIGPKPETVALLGDKVEARALAERSKVPIVKGSRMLASAEEAVAFVRSQNL